MLVACAFVLVQLILFPSLSSSCPPVLSLGTASNTKNYLANRSPSILRRVFLLIDSRQGLREKDGEMLKWFEKNEIHR